MPKQLWPVARNWCPVTTEQVRLAEARGPTTPWKKWGPYLSERQWGTVREDYSEGGNAWDYFSHDQARSRAYRWGEDGLAGISDDQQRLCFALALWNGKDPILKERLFGLTNSESNHGEDVKEYYFYLDSTPTHSYMKYLYKYPQAAYPYGDLIETSRKRSRTEFEYELLDTGVFDQDRYWDVFVEYAKDSAEDILIQISVHNRGPEAAELDVLPTLWYRNEWSWHGNDDRSSLQRLGNAVKAVDPKLGERYLYCDGDAPFLFTENETNMQRVFGVPNRTPYVKDSINEYIVHGRKDAVNPEQTGTKVAAHYHVTVKPGECRVIRLRLTDRSPADFAQGNGKGTSPFGAPFATAFELRHTEADAFYTSITPPSLDADEANVMRQALAGMLWSKQFYHYDVDKWLEERGSDPFRKNRKPDPQRRLAPHVQRRRHIDAGQVGVSLVRGLGPGVSRDLPDARRSGLRQAATQADAAHDRYIHPNGQMPAYEWNFGDVNPPVHAWSTIFTYFLEKARRRVRATEWLRRCFQKLMLNHSWWVNRKDRTGRNVFEGGFLGLDNIGVFDRSAPLPTGGHLEQADGTAWMALFCQNMLQIAVELAMTDEEYAEMALKFTEHFLWIGSAMGHMGGDTGMWDEEDEFFYDVLRWPDGRAERLKVRSMVGLLPLCRRDDVYEGTSCSRSIPRW